MMTSGSESNLGAVMLSTLGLCKKSGGSGEPGTSEAGVMYPTHSWRASSHLEELEVWEASRHPGQLVVVQVEFS